MAPLQSHGRPHWHYPPAKVAVTVMWAAFLLLAFSSLQDLPTGALASPLPGINVGGDPAHAQTGANVGGRFLSRDTAIPAKPRVCACDCLYLSDPV